MNNLASSYDDAGRRDEALKLRERVVALSRKVSGPEHPGTHKAMNNLANSYYAAGRRDEALKLREEVLALRRTVLGLNHPDTLGAMGSLADSYHAAGRRDEALQLREEVLALCRKTLVPEHPEMLWAMNRLANSYSVAGRRDEALKLREEVLPLCRKVGGPEHPETLGAMTNLAVSYNNAGCLPEALALQEESLAIKRRVLPPNHPFIAVALENLAKLYEKTGRGDEVMKIRYEVEALRLASFPPIDATLVPPDSEWKWLHPVNGEDPANSAPDFHMAFARPDFDDTKWNTGSDSEDPKGGFGYGSGSNGVDIGKPENEAHRHTAYFRLNFRTITIDTNLELRCRRDDGIIVYLDGREVVRDNVPPGPDAYLLHAEKPMGSENDGVVHRFPISGNLEPGTHVLAVSLHNTAQASSDLHLGGVTLVVVPPAAKTK